MRRYESKNRCLVHPVSAGATPRIRLAAKHNWPSRESGKPKTITIVNEDTIGLSIGRRESIPRAVLTDAVYPARLPGGAVLGPRDRSLDDAVDVDQP